MTNRPNIVDSLNCCTVQYEPTSFVQAIVTFEFDWQGCNTFRSLIRADEPLGIIVQSFIDKQELCLFRYKQIDKAGDDANRCRMLGQIGLIKLREMDGLFNTRTTLVQDPMKTGITYSYTDDLPEKP